MTLSLDILDEKEIDDYCYKVYFEFHYPYYIIIIIPIKMMVSPYHINKLLENINNNIYRMKNLLKIIRLPMSNLIKTHNTVGGPKAIGPYSTVRIYDGTMYISGQLGIDPKSG